MADESIGVDELARQRVRVYAGSSRRSSGPAEPVERVDVFVIGGGGTGSEVAFSLARSSGLSALAERDKLGGECSYHGWVRPDEGDA